jgi:hypothetical protein
MKRMEVVRDVVEVGEAITSLREEDRTELELDASNIDLRPENAVHIANMIKGSNALSKFIFHGGIEIISGWEEGDTVTLEAGVTEADFGDNKLGVAGAIVISAWLSSGNGMAALLSLNLASNCLCGLDKYGDGTFDASGIACFHYHT